MSSPVEYDGPFPPENCIQERFASYCGRHGLLYKIRGGAGVFWCIAGDAQWIERWQHDPDLQVIR